MKHVSTKQRILNKVERVISIYLMLRKKYWTLTGLATKFQVCERSILRDIKLLKEAGAKVDKYDWGGYYVRKV